MHILPPVLGCVKSKGLIFFSEFTWVFQVALLSSSQLSFLCRLSFLLVAGPAWMPGLDAMQMWVAAGSV